MTPREDAQAQIRTELDRHRPLEVSRRTLELIAELALRFPGRPGEPPIQVVDEAGAPRLMERGGARVPMDIPALVAEIREKHPALFESDATAATAAPAEARAGIVETPAAAAPAPTAAAPPPPAPRDWLMLRDGGKPAEGAAEAPRSTEGPRPEAPVAAASVAAAPMAPSPAPEKPRRRVTIAQAGAGLAAAMSRAGARLPALKEGLQTRARDASDRVVDRFDAARDAVRERRARIVEGPAFEAAAPSTGRSGPGPAAPRPLAPATPARPRLTPFLYAAALLLAGVLLYALWPDGGTTTDAPRNAVAGAAAPRAEAGAPRREPDATGAVPPADERTLRGVPEVVDTVTLRLEGRVVRLFGVEWARGGQPEDLTGYLRNREVECRPVQGSTNYRCALNGQDLSRVVLYNGGGRTSSEATPELLKAEDHARDQKLGVWKR